MSGEPSPTDRVQKLHLVGVTTDHEGLILSARRGARSGGYVLAIDDALEEAVDELRERRASEEAGHSHEEAAVHAPRVESALPVREIQARLRQGRSIAEVAKAAGVDPEWVDRFAAPILAERAQVISRVRATPLRRARLGPSAQPIGEAVRHHLADRGVALTADEFSDVWVARQVAEGRWAVRFAFHHRNRNHVLRFDLDEATGEVTAADRTSGLLGYVAPAVTPASPQRSRRKAKTAPVARSTVKRPVVSTGFRPDSPRAKPVSRSAQERQRAAAAMRKAAVQRAAEAERAAVRRAREREAEVARKERERKAAAAQAAREQRERERAQAAAERAKAAAAKAKRAAADRASKANAKERAAKAAKAERAAKVDKAAKAKAAITKARAAKATAEKAKAGRVVAAAKAKARPVKAKARPAKATAEPSPAKRLSPVKRPPAVKRKAAPGKARATSAKRTPPAKAPSSKAPAAQPAAAPRPAAHLPRSASSVAAASPGQAPDRFSFASPSAVATRASFRRGFVEKATEDHVHDRPSGASPNGLDDEVRRPLPDRPRRTRPLRAT